MAPSDKQYRHFALQRADHRMEAGCYEESAASDIFADLLRVHFFMIPADRVLVLYSRINVIADHQIIVPGFLTLDAGRVRDDHYFVTVICKVVDKVDHGLSVINALLGALRINYRAYREPDELIFYISSKKCILCGRVGNELRDRLVVLHRERAVSAEPDIVFDPDAGQIVERALAASADQFHLGKDPFGKESVPAVLKCAHRLRILNDRHLHQHRNRHRHEGIGIHDKSSAVHKGNACFVYYQIRLAVRAQDLVLAEKSLDSGDPAESSV